MKTKRVKVWKSLESLATPSAVLAEWREILGGDFEWFQAFLRAGDATALEYPCTNKPRCGCRHEVVPLSMVAACRCEDRGCESIPLEPKDVLAHVLDTVKFCAAIRSELKFGAPAEGEGTVVDGMLGTWWVGTYGAVRSAVFLMIRLTEADFVAELERVAGIWGEPFVVLAPTARHQTAGVRGILRRQRSAFISLCDAVELVGPGRLGATGNIQPILERFSAGLLEGRAQVETFQRTVEDFGRKIDAAASGMQELRKENEELKGLAAGGYLDFVRSAEPTDVCYFFYILAYGDQAKAARELRADQRRFYERVQGWAKRGPAYKRMLALVKCRKTSLRKGTVPLGASLQSGGVAAEAENPETVEAVLEEIRDGNLDQRDYPALLREMFGVLMTMDAKNWPAIKKELMGMIEEEVPQ
ncbi:MAG TPA: hypothetical protein PKI20_07180 [Verrucomicrobiota bacterium]|nr:hypothetical protein [Verrucomicrobiota bacterium]HQL77654.1 hypothetical protein [Verrucomicrobiota bacterium]